MEFGDVPHEKKTSERFSTGLAEARLRKEKDLSNVGKGKGTDCTYAEIDWNSPYYGNQVDNGLTRPYLRCCTETTLPRGRGGWGRAIKAGAGESAQIKNHPSPPPPPTWGWGEQ